MIFCYVLNNCTCFSCIVIVAELVDANNINDVTFPDANSNVSLNSSIVIPASYIQQRAMTTGKLFFPNTGNYILIIRYKSCSYCQY